MEAAPTRRSLVEAVVAACLLDADIYVAFSADRAASGRVFLVVLLTGLANGLGLAGRLGTFGISAGVGAAVLGWFLWTAVVGVIARTLGHRHAGRSLLRALGLATAPGLLLILGVVPVLGGIARVLVVFWLVAATAVAVRAAFDVSRRRAAVISALAFLVYLLLGVVSAAWLNA